MKLKIGTEGQRVGLFLGVDMRPFTHRSQKIALSAAASAAASATAFAELTFGCNSFL